MHQQGKLFFLALLLLACEGCGQESFALTFKVELLEETRDRQASLGLPATLQMMPWVDGEKFWSGPSGAGVLNEASELVTPADGDPVGKQSLAGPGCPHTFELELWFVDGEPAEGEELSTEWDGERPRSIAGINSDDVQCFRGVSEDREPTVVRF